MPITYRVMAGLVVAALLAGSGYSLGVRLERGRWLQIESDRAVAAAETARIAAAAETRRAVAQQQKRDRVAARVQVIEREYAALPASCEFVGDELRLLKRERDAYLDAGPAAVPRAVPTDAGDPAQRPQHRAQPDGVGVGLPGPSGGVHRVGDEQ